MKKIEREKKNPFQKLNEKTFSDKNIIYIKNQNY
jgi:hypothetical protein